MENNANGESATFLLAKNKWEKIRLGEHLNLEAAVADLHQYMRQSLTYAEYCDLFDYMNAQAVETSNQLAITEEQLAITEEETLERLFNASDRLDDMLEKINDGGLYHQWLKATGQQPAFVYFVKNRATEQIKIGFTRGDVADRVLKITQGLAHGGVVARLTCVASYKTTAIMAQRLERAIHDKFSEKRMIGEWFLPFDIPSLEELDKLEEKLFLETAPPIPIDRPILGLVTQHCGERISEMFRLVDRKIKLLNELTDFLPSRYDAC